MNWKQSAIAVCAASAAFITHRVYRARPDLETVAPELRNPLLPFLTMTISQRNLARNRLVMRLRTPSGPGVSISTWRTVRPPTVRVIVTEPTTKQSGLRRPVILWLHGGGLVTGSPQLESMTAGRLARTLNAVVVSPDYRLAPEDPFPASLDDCMGCLYWLLEQSESLGVDTARIAVAGASAGGGLAAAVAQRAFDEGINLCAQVLIYPMLDDRTPLQPNTGGRGRFLWTPESNAFAWSAYLGRPPQFSNPPPQYAAPARRENLSGLAPAWVGVGDLDLFYDESVEYFRALTGAGVPCKLLTVPGMYHGADGLAMSSPSMQNFARSSTEFLASYL